MQRTAQRLHRITDTACLAQRRAQFQEHGGRAWLLACVDTGGACLRVGALFLDSIGALSRDSQRSLLLLARRLDASREGYGVPPEEGPLRLMAGDRHHLAREPNAGSCSPSLIDHLDKIRVELDVSRTRGAA